MSPQSVLRPLARASVFIVAAAGISAGAGAVSPAATACPDYFFLSDNIALNSDFETPTPGVPVGSTTCWMSGDPTPPPSAADQWLMHSSNSSATVCSTLVPSTVPGKAPGGKMIRFRAGGNEGGIYYNAGVPAGHAYMFSAWVKVLRGQVALQPNGGNLGPVSWTSKIGEWEQLRTCTNSTGVTDLLVIYNQDPAGGVFEVDRVELREVPIRE
jgi:hypothetical protein